MLETLALVETQRTLGLTDTASVQQVNPVDNSVIGGTLVNVTFVN